MFLPFWQGLLNPPSVLTATAHAVTTLLLNSSFPISYIWVFHQKSIPAVPSGSHN